MKDFYGNDYERAMWTRFSAISYIFGFETKRTKAFEVWANNVVNEIKQLGYTPEVFREVTPNIGGDIVWYHIKIPAITRKREYVLSLNHYDNWTKQEADPAKTIISNLQWYASIGE